MKGSTFKRKLPSGKTGWCVQLDTGKDASGRRKRIFKSGYRRQGDADAELTRLLQELNEGTLVKPDPRTVSEFMNQWIAEYAARKVAPTTLERYNELARHVTRAIGTVQLTKVTTLQLQRVYNGLLDSNGTVYASFRGPLAPRPVCDGAIDGSTARRIAGARLARRRS